VSRVLQLLPGALKDIPLVHAVPHTTRTARDGEVNGRDYHFVTQTEFESMLERMLFIEAGLFKVCLLIAKLIFLHLSSPMLTYRTTYTEQAFLQFAIRA
jgi:hypothetical protein